MYDIYMNHMPLKMNEFTPDMNSQKFQPKSHRHSQLGCRPVCRSRDGLLRAFVEPYLPCQSSTIPQRLHPRPLRSTGPCKLSRQHRFHRQSTTTPSSLQRKVTLNQFYVLTKAKPQM
ncbi:hypothetical protein Hanom_Chr09g00856281 [Helianthus anomalus]